MDLPSLEELSTLPRKKLQRICKVNCVKANLKNVELVAAIRELIEKKNLENTKIVKECEEDKEEAKSDEGVENAKEDKEETKSDEGVENVEEDKEEAKSDEGVENTEAGNNAEEQPSECLEDPKKIQVMTDLTNCKELDEQKTPVVSDLEDAPEIQSEDAPVQENLINRKRPFEVDNDASFEGQTFKKKSCIRDTPKPATSKDSTPPTKRLRKSTFEVPVEKLQNANLPKIESQESKMEPAEKDEILNIIEKRVSERMATEPLARTSLSSIHNQKENRPKAAGVKDWDAIHAKVFNRMPSITDSHQKKLKSQIPRKNNPVNNPGLYKFSAKKEGSGTGEVKKVFNLQSSLNKSMKYKPHKGPLPKLKY